MGRFYSETRRPNRVKQPLTNKYEPEYEERLDTKTGKKYLKQTGKTNVYEKIQAATEGSTLKELIKRYGIDPSVSAETIESETGKIFDYTGQPKTLMEALELTNEAKSLFDRASQEIKQKFNNNFTEFLASANNGNLAKILEEFKKPKTEKIEEPKANEVKTQEKEIKYE